MKINTSRERVRMLAMTNVGLLTAAWLTLATTSLSAKEIHYQQVNLVSDLPGVAMLQDTNLVNAWGVAFGPTSPFWVTDNGTGKATIYAVTNDAGGTLHIDKNTLEVNIPGEGNPTGQVFNNLGGFNGDIFLFVSEDGTVSGWRPALGANAEVLAVRSNAVYKGVALAPTSHGPVLLAANFSEGTVDVYGTNGVLITQFIDHAAPADYAPFNVQSVNGTIFVTFAKQDEEKEDDVPGRGHGLIDVLNPETGVFHRFVTGSDAGGKFKDIDSPWGIALAPSNFGKHSDQLLVGNFGSGTIMAFDEHGKFRGLLKSAEGGPVRIEGLWALTFGNGTSAGATDTLFFTAGPDDEEHGLFGLLEPAGDDED